MSHSGHQPDTQRQKILVTGWRKAGKSSCVQTVFDHLPIKDVPYIGITQRVEQTNYDTIVPLQIWDTPSNFDVDQLSETPLAAFSTMVFVIDMQQDEFYHDAVRQATSAIMRGYLANPGMKFSVFIHKAESLSEDYRLENYSEIQRAVIEELEDLSYPSFQRYAPNFDLSDVNTCTSIFNHLQAEIKYEMTSVHDVSLRNAWSRVIQDVMEMLPAVEALLLNFTETSSIDNSYLFDLESGVVLATDNRHRNDATMEQITEYLERFRQIRDIYRPLTATAKAKAKDGGSASGDDGDGDDANGNGNGGGGGAGGGGGGGGGGDAGSSPSSSAASQEPWWEKEDYDAPWTTNASRLMPNCTLAMWQFTPQLVLVADLHTDTWQARRGMIEYNLTFLRQGVRRILMEV